MDCQWARTGQTAHQQVINDGPLNRYSKTPFTTPILGQNHLQRDSVCLADFTGLIPPWKPDSFRLAEQGLEKSPMSVDLAGTYCPYPQYVRCELAYTKPVW
jgi:hypothetical protein